MRWSPTVTRSVSENGELQVAVGHPMCDEYLEFLRARARANTLLARAFDLKVFFPVVDRPPPMTSTAPAPPPSPSGSAFGQPSNAKLSPLDAS